MKYNPFRCPKARARSRPFRSLLLLLRRDRCEMESSAATFMRPKCEDARARVPPPGAHKQTHDGAVLHSPAYYLWAAI